ncbi:MAG: hypothetical protein KKC99_09050, partial [Proteobacteria bacterium]|nr:hypothetical protein [Pseudomonadota bacterium]
MKPPTIGLGMIVHPQDTHLLSPFLARHQASFDAVSIVLDAEVETVSASALIRSRFQAAPHRLRLAERVLGRDFATQRNFCASLNPCDWLLMLDMDERLHVRMLQLLKPVLAMVLSKTPETRVIGFARRNVIDGRATEVWPD